MQTLLTPEEFVSRAVGIPWVRWRSDWTAVDCFGVVTLYYRTVLGIELGPVPGTDIAQGFHASQGWSECSAEPGATCFMAWDDGAPTHCGVLLTTTDVLHADGSVEHPGSVRVTRLRAMQQIHQDIRFYRYAPTC
ncbi:hypothetical protein BH10PSE18_BH10PSE18_08410 [soil metagenome]